MAKRLRASLRIPMIDDADDAGINGRFNWIERKARFPTAHEEHFFADTCANRIDRNKRPAGGFPIGRQWLHHEERDTGKVLVLPRGDDGADHPGELHVRTRRRLCR